MTRPDPRPALVAIGDVHGCATLLREAIWPHLGSGAELILLGDLIDRSPEPDGDRLVIELVRELQTNPEVYGLAGVTVLRGNHEQMLLDALAEDEAGEATELWHWNGGNPPFLQVAREHQDWLGTLPLTAIRGTYLFVHAGVRPGLELEDQQADDLLWIRRPFLQPGPPKSLSTAPLAGLSALALVGGSHRFQCPESIPPQPIRVPGLTCSASSRPFQMAVPAGGCVTRSGSCCWLRCSEF